jgi:deoxyribonuclease-4
MPRIGSHCSAAGGPAHAVHEALALGLDCVQVFTANQRQWKPKGPGEADVRAWFEAVKIAGWSDPEDHRTVSHNSYLVNLANPDAAARDRSLALQRSELERCERLGIRLCVMHPGAHLGATRKPGEPNDLEAAPTEDEQEGLRRIARGLDALHRDLRGFKVITCLENTVGSGTNLGYRFMDLARIREMVREPERVAFCIDTCHAVAAGYRMDTTASARTTVQGMIAALGERSIKVFHLNDSIGACGSRKDRHAHIGSGTCGASAFTAILRRRAWARTPMILETPKEGTCKGRPWDAVNAERLRMLARPTRRAARPLVALALMLGLLVKLPACKVRTLEEIRGETPPPTILETLQAGKPTTEEAATIEKARARIDRGDYEAALSMFQEVLRENPKLPDAWVGVGDAHASMKEWTEAETAYANATTLDNGNFDAHFGRGKALQVLNRLIDAIRSYHRALLIRPEDFDANLNMATAYLQLDQPQSSITYAEKAVKLKPDSGTARINLGVAYERAGRAADAVAQYETAAELMEPTPQLLINLLNAYAQSRRYREAVNAAGLLVRIAPTANSWERLGWACFRQGDFPRSLESYRESVRVDPQHWPGWNGVGVNMLNSWLQGGRKDSAQSEQAMAAFRKSLQINPEQVKVQKLLQTYAVGP